MPRATRAAADPEADTVAAGSFSWFDAVNPFDRLGANPRFEGCVFARSGYALGSSASLSDGGGSDGLRFVRNTARPSPRRPSPDGHLPTGLLAGA